jgi:hypothetical protein
MQNIFTQLEQIKVLLDQAGYKHLADDILEQQLAGAGSGTEVLMRVCGRLQGIKERYTDAYTAIASKADKLIKYCRNIGLYPFTSYLE